MRYPADATPAFKKQLRLEAAVHAAVSKKPVRTVTGRLLRGASFYERQWEGHATVEVPLVAWSVDDGPVNKGTLLAYLHCPWKNVRSAKKGCTAGAIVRMKARLAEKTKLGTARAQIVKIEGPVKSPKLAALGSDQKPEPMIRHATLGVFRRDARSGQFAARLPWRGRRIAVSIEALTNKELADALAALEKLTRAQRVKDAAFRSGAASRLMSVARRWCKDVDEAPPTSTELARALKLKSISVFAGRGFQVSYDAGSLFGGHEVVVEVGARGGITDVDLQG